MHIPSIRHSLVRNEHIALARNKCPNHRKGSTAPCCTQYWTYYTSENPEHMVTLLDQLCASEATSCSAPRSEGDNLDVALNLLNDDCGWGQGALMIGTFITSEGESLNNL